MGKHANKKKKFPVWSRVIFIALILLTASAIGFSAWKKWSVDPAENTGRTGAEGQKEQNANSDDAGEKVNAVEFPYKLEEGKISIDSVFQFTGFNPDNENMEGENIAALTVVNQSEQHLTFAQFTVKLADGARLAFEVTDLPAGQKAMIFEKENQVYELDDVCQEITDTAEFEDVSPVMADRLSAEVQETTVTLTNNSEEDLSNLLLHCHCVIDDAYFGGLTYMYPIESIPAGQSASVNAEDCYLGQAAVVRVSQDSGEE